MKFNKKMTLTLPVVTGLLYILMVVMNGLANALPINGVTSGEVSDKYFNLFAPAGITFSIWGVIYILLGIYTIYQIVALRNQESYERLHLSKINVLYCITSGANALWILSWHFEILWLSLILITVILVGLIFIRLELDKVTLKSKEKWLIRLPFSVYFGWLTIATIANVAVLLVSLNWNGFGLSPVFWTVLILIIGIIISGLTTFRFKDIPYALVILWAYTGILIRHTSTSALSGQYPVVIVTVSFCIVAIVVGIGEIVRRYFFSKESYL